MNLVELNKILPTLISNREPVLLVGPPGCGKTTVVKDIAKSLDHRLVIRHPVVEESVDSKGLPAFYEGGTRARFTLTDDWRQLIETTEPTVCLIDDIGQAPNSVQAPYMQWMLERSCNGQRLSDHVTFVACTNRRGDAAGVQGLITPLLSRFTTVINVDFDVAGWVKWAIAAGMPNELIGYARFRPDNIGNSFKPSRDMEPSPTPRGWASVGRMFNLGITGDGATEAWTGAVGKGAAVEFKAFVDVYGKLPDTDDILKDPTNHPLPDKPDVTYALLTALSSIATVKNLGTVLKFIERLPMEHQAVFMVDAYARLGVKIVTHPAYTKWVQANKSMVFS